MTGAEEAWKAEAELWRNLAMSLDDLLTCQLVGRRPPDDLLDSIRMWKDELNYESIREEVEQRRAK